MGSQVTLRPYDFRVHLGFQLVYGLHGTKVGHSHSLQGSVHTQDRQNRQMHGMYGVVEGRRKTGLNAEERKQGSSLSDCGGLQMSLKSATVKVMVGLGDPQAHPTLPKAPCTFIVAT